MLVNQKFIPDGHCVDAYGCVHLHKPSVVYGVGSKQLEDHLKLKTEQLIGTKCIINEEKNTIFILHPMLR